MAINSIIIRGTSDPWYEYGKDLETHFVGNQQQVIEHTEGHRVPKNQTILQEIAGSIRNALDLPRLHTCIPCEPPCWIILETSWTICVPYESCPPVVVFYLRSENSDA